MKDTQQILCLEFKNKGWKLIADNILIDQNFERTHNLFCKCNILNLLAKIKQRISKEK